MGVWAVPIFRTMFDLAGYASFCMIACGAAYLVMPRRRWISRAFIASMACTALTFVGFFGSKYYYENIDTKTLFMAQCRLGGSETACLADYHRFYRS